VYTQGREKSDYKEYRAKYKNTLHFMPVVVLINQYSASASEIVAGALRDSGKALIIGENSYGKGSVQTIFRTSSGSGLRLTTSKYYTPSGTDITEQGITPEIRVLKDPIPEELKSSGKSKTTPLKDNLGSPIQLKESEIVRFIKENGLEVEESNDPTLQFAQILIKDVSVANKKQTLKKAHELAVNIYH
jgi:C-terminal processing protease CtpA/Prc